MDYKRLLTQVERTLEHLESSSNRRLNIAQIAAEVGCSCQSHLTNLLRKYAGTTPRACRTATRQTRRDTTAAGGSPLAALPKEIAGTRATAARIRDSL